MSRLLITQILSFSVSIPKHGASHQNASQIPAKMSGSIPSEQMNILKALRDDRVRVAVKWQKAKDAVCDTDGMIYPKHYELRTEPLEPERKIALESELKILESERDKRYDHSGFLQNELQCVKTAIKNIKILISDAGGTYNSSEEDRSSDPDESMNEEESSEDDGKLSDADDEHSKDPDDGEHSKDFDDDEDLSGADNDSPSDGGEESSKGSNELSQGNNQPLDQTGISKHNNNAVNSNSFPTSVHYGYGVWTWLDGAYSEQDPNRNQSRNEFQQSTPPSTVDGHTPKVNSRKRSRGSEDSDTPPARSSDSPPPAVRQRRSNEAHLSSGSTRCNSWAGGAASALQDVPLANTRGATPGRPHVRHPFTPAGPTIMGRPVHQKGGSTRAQYCNP